MRPPINLLYFTTGRINPDNSIYYPPLVKAQILSLEHAFASWRLFILCKTNLLFFIGFVWNARKENKFPNSIVHAQYGSLTALAAALSAKNAALVISFGGSDVYGTGAKGVKWAVRDWITRRLGWLAALRCDAIIVKSGHLFDSLPEMFKKKAIIIPNGVRTNLFFPASQRECRKQLGWMVGETYLLFTPGKANNESVKNAPLAMEVWERVKQKMPEVKLELILDKEPSEVALMMNAADCLLLTSLHEGSPNVVKEAMACNLPVVTVDVGDVPERLLNVNPSKVMSSYDPQTMADAVLEILQDKRRSHGYNELIKQGLSTEMVADRIISLYYEILEKNGRKQKKLT